MDIENKSKRMAIINFEIPAWIFIAFIFAVLSGGLFVLSTHLDLDDPNSASEVIAAQVSYGIAGTLALLAIITVVIGIPVHKKRRMRRLAQAQAAQAQPQVQPQFQLQAQPQVQAPVPTTYTLHPVAPTPAPVPAPKATT